MQRWEFWIDVGGTFTDCIARSPNDELLTCKTLSSGATKGELLDLNPERTSFCDPLRLGEPVDFWTGYQLTLSEFPDQSWRVTAFDAEAGRIYLDRSLPPDLPPGVPYELRSHESAPLIAIRKILGLALNAEIPAVTVKLGTTRGTNALLERKGARVAFVTTKGFGDVLLIGNQNRPKLFELDIRKPEPLAECVIEIDERLSAEGDILAAPDPEAVKKQLQELRETGIRSLAICLLHAWKNPVHEQLVQKIAQAVGFTEISVSSKLSPLIKIVSRGDTTVMDAYLSPIIREYLIDIRSSLGPESSLKLMTSAGGLVDAERFVGKDSILSGPAGGVVGYARVAEQAGFDKAIGFDMGGTSTDVSRYDGVYEREYETEKGGVRVVAPMLAIETVAAGGGSICQFDGVKLAVGPESSGADPGPACYGRGGPLAVTDLNVALGRVPADQFPFPIDESTVLKHLETMCAEIADSPLGKQYEPLELAEGFLRIANENMVRAIRKISVARGYDPADHVLVSFGGAGGQHACAIARALGIPQILLHPYAGILSAYGIGLADVRRFREQSIFRELNSETLKDLTSTFAKLTQQASDDVIADGLPAEQISQKLESLDLRYVGAETTLNIPRPDDGDYRSAFERRHREIYGYLHDSRPLEVTAARVEVVGSLPHPPQSITEPVPRTPQPDRMTETIFNGEAVETAIFQRQNLHPGDSFAGPAIVCEEISTVVVEPGFRATVDSRHCLIIEHRESDHQVSLATDVDPVMLEIFNNLFASIAEQMGVTLQQTSFSTNVKERLDFSCAVFSPAGDLVVNAPHIPVHLGAMSETVKGVLAGNPDLAPGDVIVTNDPYRGGSHLPDVTVVTPVHDSRSDELLFLTASRAHHSEIGGIVPGSMPPFSKNLAKEGVLIQNFKLVDAGQSREPQLRELLLSGEYPSRAVDSNLRDVSAQVAANQLGVRLLTDLVDRYSLAVVQAYMGHIQQAAAEKMRMSLAHIPDGTYSRTDHLDDGSPITVHIQIQGETARVDFTGTGPVLATNLNANRAIVTAAVLYVMRCLIDEDIPLNSGVLDPVTIVLPECLLNPPRHEDPADCAAIVGGNVETSQRVVDVLLGSLNLAAASQGTMNNFTFGDESFGYYETICGGAGATSENDGADAVHTHMTNTRLTDVEVIEQRYPVRLKQFAIRRGSGGAGKHRGGDGIIREIEFLKELDVSLLTERRGDYRPFGLEGGQPGENGQNLLHRHGDSSSQKLDGKAQIKVSSGDVLRIVTPGGGGFGAE
ncbi:MAG: hydantoinase B/oxoprolinase family protein [Planctomycetaceae bacterium]|nr:hydantoinase B/oxoprolinase family protein [Planctomycetaceae bacterium]